MVFFPRLAVVLLALFALVGPSSAQSRRALRDPTPPLALEETQIRDRLNAGTIGLAGGLSGRRAHSFRDGNRPARER